MGDELVGTDQVGNSIMHWGEVINSWGRRIQLKIPPGGWKVKIKPVIIPRTRVTPVLFRKNINNFF